MSAEFAIIIEGKRFTGWKGVSLTRSMENMSPSWSVILTDVWEENIWDLFPGREVVIKDGPDTMMKGFIDFVKPSVASSAHELKIGGRGMTGDLVDCSIPTEPSKWTNLKTIALLRALAEPFGVRVIDDVGGLGSVKSFETKTGEKVHEAIRRICDMGGLLPMENRSGELVITKSRALEASDSLGYGVNIETAGASYDHSNRFSSYIVRGQKSGGGSRWGGGSAPSTQVRGESADAGVSRFRPLIFKADRQATTEFAERRASWEANVRAARSEKITVRVNDWRQSEGQLWDANMLVKVNIPPLRVQGVLLITAIDYGYDNNGTKVTLTMMREDAFEPKPVKPPKTSKSVVRW